MGKETKEDYIKRLEFFYSVAYNRNQEYVKIFEDIYDMTDCPKIKEKIERVFRIEGIHMNRQ